MSEKQETIGSTILSIKEGLVNAVWLFEQIKEYNYDNIKPDMWYPMKQFTLLTDYYEQKTGPAVMRKIGMGIIPRMLDAGVIPKVSPEDFLKGLSKVYHAANRGSNIGDWTVLNEEKKHIILKNTTMHNCHLEEGVVYAGIKAMGGKIPRIKQTSCVKSGDSECIFDIAWM